MSLIAINQTVAAPSCKDVISACDQALADKTVVITKANKVIEDQQAYSQTLNLQLNEAKDDLDAWYRNPAIIIPLGIAVGAFGGIYLFKK